jgi:hypothetical protein
VSVLRGATRQGAYILASFSALVVSVSAAPTGAIASLPATLTVAGQSSLGGRGMNAALAVAGGCAYVGSRSDSAPLIVDISNPATPLVTGQLTRHTGSTPRELRAVPALRELVVMYYAINGGPNGLDLYRWGDDCKAPSLAGRYDFGGHSPHEFYLWRDPATPARVLTFVTMFASAGNALNVIDVSNPARPGLIGGWSPPSNYGYAPLHSIALTPDGRTAYLSLWTGGLVVADSSDFASGAGQPLLRLSTPAGGRYRTPPGNVHSAVPVPGRALVVTTDERYPSPYGQGCPYGTAHVVDVSSPEAPAAVSTLAIPENDPSTCATAGSGTWTSHNPTVTSHLALVSWYSGGLQLFGLDDPARPSRLAELRPAGTSPGLRDVQLGTSAAMTWSYPVISGGLIYVVDINQGLLVVRYQGPHQDEVENTAFAEGNSNIVASGASPVVTPSSAPTATSTPAPPPSRGGGSAKTSIGALPWIIGAGAFMLALGLRLAGGVRRGETARRPRTGPPSS